MAGRPPLDERPSQSLQVVDYVGLAVPNEIAPAAAAWATSASSSSTASQSLDALWTDQPETPGFRFTGAPAAGERSQAREQRMLVAHAATIATSTHWRALSTCP